MSDAFPAPKRIIIRSNIPGKDEQAQLPEDRLMLSTVNGTSAAGNMGSTEKNSRETLGKALGRIASGVFVVTTRQSGQNHGFLATWISQAAFEPPSVTIAFNKERGILQILQSGSVVTINVLSKNNMNLFKVFAKPAQQEHDDRFAGLNLLENAEGGPVFAEAVSYLNCRIKEFIDAGDHVVALAELTDGAPLQADAEPMVHFRNNGFQY
jgi:flavin reductase (DIM6/NTAB) family NADH-FMN oxidoreductase RutF